jgi:hypothetical protein
MGYAILKNNRRTVRVEFPSYEAARQYLRKLIRKMGREAYIATLDKSGYMHAYSPSVTATWDEVSRNPTNFTELGYSIRALQ